MRLAHAGTFLAAGGLLLALTACSQGPDAKTTKLNHVLDELDLSTISEIACDYTLVPAFFNPSGNDHQRNIGLEGPGHSDEAVRRLTAAGFTFVDDRSGVLVFTGADGIQASVAVTPPDFELNGTEVDVDGSYSCTYPENGMTEVELKLE